MKAPGCTRISLRIVRACVIKVASQEKKREFEGFEFGQCVETLSSFRIEEMKMDKQAYTVYEVEEKQAFNELRGLCCM